MKEVRERPSETDRERERERETQWNETTYTHVFIQ